MFRDREKELQRLQEQLLEEEDEVQDQNEDLLDEETVDSLLEDDDQAQDPGIYQNFSNDYGRQSQEDVPGGRFYNADRVDVDLDDYAEEVCRPDKKRGCTGFLVVLLLLMLAVLGCMVWLYWRMGGFL